MDSFWEELGLTDNPYDPRPLTISKEGRKLFVGRNKELSQLNSLVSGKKGGIVIIEGNVGVGKTSFVNIFQHDKWKKNKYLPSFEKIGLVENVDSVNFMLSVFSNMIHNLERADNTDAYKRHPIHKQAKSLIATTIEKGYGGQFSVLGTGGGISQQKSISQPVAIVLPSIVDMMNKWIQFVIDKMGYPAILVPIDNLDIIQESGIVEFLNRMRDTLIERSSVWWILIGKIGLFSLLERETHRVSEIITGKPIILQPLTLDEIHEMIKIRFENLKVITKVESLVPREIVDILYEVSKGEARYILKRITDIVYLFKSKYPSEKQIPLAIAKQMITEEAKQRIDEAKLTPRELQFLKMMAKKGTFQPRDYKHFGLNTLQALKHYVDRLSMHGFIAKEETTGKAVYYHTTGDVNLFLRK